MALSIVNASAYSNFADALNMAEGGILYIPPGTYPVRGTTRPPGNIHVEGAVGSILTPDFTNYYSNWVNAWGQYMFYIQDKQNVTLENITIDMGTLPRQYDNLFQGVEAITSSNVKLLGVTILNAQSGIAVHGSTDVIIDSPRILNCGDDRDIPTADSTGDGLYIGRTSTGSTNEIACERVHISNAYIKNKDRGGRIGYCVEGGTDVTFRDGYVQGYDREVHWETNVTTLCSFTNSMIVHKPSEKDTTYAWNYRYKCPVAFYSVGNGCIWIGNKIVSEQGANCQRYGIDWSSGIDIFRANVGVGFPIWNGTGGADGSAMPAITGGNNILYPPT